MQLGIDPPHVLPRGDDPLELCLLGAGAVYVIARTLFWRRPKCELAAGNAVAASRSDSLRVAPLSPHDLEIPAIDYNWLCSETAQQKTAGMRNRE